MFMVQEDIPIQTDTAEAASEFEARFLRCQRLLHFIAGRVLANPVDANRAVLNCWRTSSRDPRTFFYEGDFRSYLLRVLIDEALAIRNLRERSHSPGSKHRRYCPADLSARATASRG